MIHLPVILTGGAYITNKLSRCKQQDRPLLI